MQKELIRLLEPGKKVFLIGIGGVGMSGLARLLAAKGLEVSGSDLKRTKTASKLEAEGISVFIGHEGSFESRPDLAVYSSAIAKSNVDYQKLETLGVPLFHRADVLSFIMNQVISLAITGAHGKTTSSSMVSFLMTQAGLKPSCLVGGEILNFGSNVLIGDPHLYVAEVDESDKSQLCFSPDLTLITNLDAEHLDVYRDLEDIKNSFRSFIDRIKTTGSFVYCVDDPNLKEIASDAQRGGVSYGFSEAADFYPKDIHLNGFHSSYTLYEKGKPVGPVHLSIPGLHNVLNSVGVIALLRTFRLEYAQFLKFLPDFKGASRRFEVKLNRPELLIIDDYAHHPTEIKATVQTLKALGKKVTVVFQPHRFSRTLHLAKDFGPVFEHADRVLLTDIYGAGEPNPNQVHVNVIYEAVKKCGHPDVRIVSRDQIIDFLVSHQEGDQTVAFLGAGDIGEVADEFAGRFETAYSH